MKTLWIVLKSIGALCVAALIVGLLIAAVIVGGLVISAIGGIICIALVVGLVWGLLTHKPTDLPK